DAVPVRAVAGCDSAGSGRRPLAGRGLDRPRATGNDHRRRRGSGSPRRDVLRARIRAGEGSPGSLAAVVPLPGQIGSREEATPIAPAESKARTTGHAATVELRHVTKVYGAREKANRGAVNDLSLTVPAGKICVLVGPSGCGKTTTLKM